MKLGIFLPNWIGDVAMATPALRAMRKHYGPQAQFVGIMRPYVADVLVGTPFLDDRIFFNPRAKDPQLRGWQFAKRLRQERFDVVVLMTNSLRTAFWGWVSGAPQRVGFARDARDIFLTHKVHPPLAGGKYAPQSTLDAYLQIAYALGCPAESPRMELATLPEDEALADRAFQTLEMSPDRPYVVLNSGGAFGASKLWPTEYFAELGRRIAVDWDYNVLVICGPKEREIASQIVALAGHKRVMSLADPRLGDSFPLPIGLSKVCVRRAALMVTTDSGPRHFSAAFDVPVITVYGPTPVSLSDTHFDKAINLFKPVPCGPCLETVCPLAHHRCMRDLTVDEVYAAVVTQLGAREGTVVLEDGGPAHHAPGAGTLLLDGTATATPNAEVPRPLAGSAQIWIHDQFRPALANAGLDSFTALMGTTDGRLLRALPDRENWQLRLHPPQGAPRPAFLKKHHVRSVAHWLQANVARMTPPTPGRVEAENVRRLEADGIRAMPVIAFGEQLHTSGLLESFVLTEELTGYMQLDDYLYERFTAQNSRLATGARRDRAFDRLLAGIAEVAGRFHRLGYNHRDLYCCHFFVRETAAGEFSIRMIDLQRVQHRTRWRRRWIVKDLAQLLYSTPREFVNRTRLMAFYKAYLGVTRLTARDKRLARSVLRKERSMERKMGPYR